MQTQNKAEFYIFHAQILAKAWIRTNLQTHTKQGCWAMAWSEFFNSIQVNAARRAWNRSWGRRGRPFVYPIFCSSSPISEKPFSRVRACSASMGRRAPPTTVWVTTGRLINKTEFLSKIASFSGKNSYQWIIRAILHNNTNFHAHLIDRSLNNEQNMWGTIEKIVFLFTSGPPRSSSRGALKVEQLICSTTVVDGTAPYKLCFKCIRGTDHQLCTASHWMSRAELICQLAIRRITAQICDHTWQLQMKSELIFLAARPPESANRA
jgi:hypothetical protein